MTLKVIVITIQKIELGATKCAIFGTSRVVVRQSSPLMALNHVTHRCMLSDSQSKLSLVPYTLH